MEHHAAELLLKKLQDGVSWDDLGMMKKEARQLQLNKSSWHRKLEQAPHRRTLDSATKTPGTSTLREPLGREKPTSSAPLVDNSSEIQLNQKAVATSELHEPGESKLRVQERTPPPRKVTHTKDTSLSSKELPVERPPDYDTWEPWMQKKWEWQHARVTYKRHDQSPIYHYDEQERDQAFIPEVILKSWKTVMHTYFSLIILSLFPSSSDISRSKVRLCAQPHEP